MESSTTQLRFFQHIKTILPANVSFVDEIADLLDISNDSAYRRIRAEKAISFEELQKLCVKYKVSLDQFLNLQSDAFIFTGKLDNDVNFGFTNWLEEVYKQYAIIDHFEKNHLYFLCKDFTFNLHFQIPELAAFKYFVWMRCFLDFHADKGEKFSFNYPGFEIHNKIGLGIMDIYNRIPSTEILNAEGVNTTLMQILYYYEAGGLVSYDQAMFLCDKLEELVNHVERQAEHGVKFKIGEKPNTSSVVFRLFNNELIMGDNTALVELGDMKVTFLNHSFMHLIGTRDETFNNAMFNYMNNIMHKSTLISASNERERVRFFNRLRAEIHRAKARLI